jgi:hypothetical protein
LFILTTTALNDYVMSLKEKVQKTFQDVREHFSTK